jgi:hypothetical protein
MRQSDANPRSVAMVALSTIAFALLVVTTVAATDARAQSECVTSSGATAQPDHLKCYRVTVDPSINTDLLSLNSPQFGLEPDCQLDGHAVQFCVPVCKTIVGPVPPPPGTGFVGQPLTDDYLCYIVRCAQNNAPKNLGVEDQFAARTIGLGFADSICAPATKLTPPPPCGFAPAAAESARQCGGACPADQACKFTPPERSSTGAATCACAQNSTPCGPSPLAAACGGSCPPTTSGAEQLCRDLGGNCTCTPF